MTWKLCLVFMAFLCVALSQGLAIAQVPDYKLELESGLLTSGEDVVEGDFRSVSKVNMLHFVPHPPVCDGRNLTQEHQDSRVCRFDRNILLFLKSVTVCFRAIS